MDPDAISAVANLGQKQLIHLSIGSARMIGLMLIFPIFTRIQLGLLIRNGIALGMALPLLGTLGPQIDLLGEDALSLALLAAKEVAVGALFGLLLGVPFWGIQAAGELIDTQRDAVSGGVDDPSTGGQSAAMAALLGFVAIVLFVTNGGLGTMIGVHYASYAFWPLDAFSPTLDAVSRAAAFDVLESILSIGVLIAAPVLVLLITSDLSIFALARLAPQIATYTLAPLVKNTLFAVFVLAYIRFMPDYIGDIFPSARMMEEALRAFAPR